MGCGRRDVSCEVFERVVKSRCQTVKDVPPVRDLQWLALVPGIRNVVREPLRNVLGKVAAGVDWTVVRVAARTTGNAQPGTQHSAGDDGAVVAQRHARDVPLPRLQWQEWPSRVGRRLAVGIVVRSSGRPAPYGWRTGWRPPGSVEAVLRAEAALGDVGAVRGERLPHDSVVQAGFAAAAALDEGEAAACFSERVAAVKAAGLFSSRTPWR
jgi:hypothetical protein